MPKYEAAVYNAEVRKLVAEGKEHTRLSPDWADMQYIEIFALNDDHAREKFEKMHPSAEGFVFGEVVKTDGS